MVEVYLQSLHTVNSSDREQGLEDRKGGGRGGGRGEGGGARRGGGKREGERRDSRGDRGRRRGNPPQESAWSRGKPHSAREEGREFIPAKKYEEPPQPVSVTLIS